MFKTKGFCMQRLPWQHLETILHKLLVFGKGCAFKDLVPTIAFIIEKGVANMFHVHPYLVSSSGFQSAGNKGNITQAFPDTL